jgi:uncharacterized membrane protein YozB (DUF420 family)
MLSYAVLPHLNAILNGASAVLASIGFICIRKKKKNLHRACMIAAVALSMVFLASYLIYHAEAGTVRLQKQGWIRPAYFAILISHTTLAVLVLPLVFLTLRQAFARRFSRHRCIARWTLPVWLYVSATGVVVYWILYR